MTSPEPAPNPPWFKRATLLGVAALLLSSGVALWVDGRVPAAVPSGAPEYSLATLGDALRAVDAKGQVDLAELKARHASLEKFLESMAATAPATTPDKFPTPEDKVAFWLNAYHALVLDELLDVRSASASATSLSERGRTWPIGGQRLTKYAIARRFLSETGDARVLVALFTGARGRGVLDGAPFDGDTLNPQLDDAMRRFVRRKENVSLESGVVHVSRLLKEYEADFLAALPDERKNLLQIVWAYLPESCDGERPGCDTRGDLDRACGQRFDKCSVVYTPIDEALAVKN